MRRLEGDTWRSSALRALPMPSWLGYEGHGSEIVLSCRVRLARNLAGHRFPAAASTEENAAVMNAVLAAAEGAAEGYEAFPSLTKAERDHYVGTRLLSPDFPWTRPGRAVLFDPSRTTAILVNEEDHLRLQVVTGGATWETGLEIAGAALDRLHRWLTFARTERHGHLTASVYNAGEGRRISAMLHLIGLATADRIADVLPALGAGRIVFRGLFGETSRAIGAFAQVSTISRNADEFRGALQYLTDEEARARQEADPSLLKGRCDATLDSLARAPTVTMSDALRSLGLLRWGVSAGYVPALSLRQIDYALCVAEFRAGNDPALRADNLRHDLHLA